MNWQTYTIILLVLVVVYQFLDKKIEKIKKTDFSKSYKKRMLLTKHEWTEYKKLKKYTDEKGLMICPKVRLLDLVQPISSKDYISLKNKVQSKHVDFVITDQDLNVISIFELDDQSHNREDRKERDQFVDEVLNGAGYKIVHANSVSANIIEKLIGNPAPGATLTRQRSDGDEEAIATHQRSTEINRSDCAGAL